MMPGITISGLNLQLFFFHNFSHIHFLNQSRSTPVFMYFSLLRYIIR